MFEQYTLIKRALILSFILCAPVLAIEANSCQAKSPVKIAMNTESGMRSRDLLKAAAEVQNGPLVKDMVDGTDFINQMLSAAQSYSTYSFDYQMTVYKGNDPIVEKGKLFYKKPRLLRVEVTDGPNQGAVAVLAKNGKVLAKPGKGFASFVNLFAGKGVQLAPNSKFLRSANGYPMVQSDYLSLSEALKKFLKEGVKSRVSDKPMAFDGHATPVYVLEMYKPKEGGQVWKRVIVDSQSYLPVEWFDNENGKLFTHSQWKDFKANQQLSEDVFTSAGGTY